MFEVGDEVHVVRDAMGEPHKLNGTVSAVFPLNPFPYGVYLESGIYVRAAAKEVTKQGER